MPNYNWKPFLDKYSCELLEDPKLEHPASAADAQWMGVNGATEDEITAVEQRIGKRLPPSYREFLLQSNGWHYPGAFIYQLLPVSKIDWFRNLHQDWYDTWMESAREYGELPPITDAEYFVYGPQQDSCKFRDEYWIETLTISEIGDSAVYLLNPMVIDSDGEWEAWFFSNWGPGADRFRSFWEMIHHDRESYLRLRNDD